MNKRIASLGALCTLCGCLATAQTTVQRAEYWLDSDPGHGRATAIAVTPAAMVDLQVQVPTDNLEAGWHVLGIRSIGDNGRWSQTYTHRFFKPAAAVQARLTNAEYFIDEDPGHGKATAIPFTAGQQLFDIDVPTVTLSEGVHLLGLRVKFNDKWSQTYTHRFVTVGAKPAPMAVEAVEYYWDTDSENATAIPFAMAGDSVVIDNFEISTAALTYGLHYLNLRAKANGVWSVVTRYEVCKNAVPKFSLDNNDVCVGDMFIVYNETAEANAETVFAWDMDGDGMTDYTTADDMFTHTYDKAGTYTATLTVKTGEGCETAYSQTVTVHSKSAPSVSLRYDQSSVCKGNEITFTAQASNAGKTPTFRWYKNNVQIENASSETLHIDDLNNNDKVKVTVISSNPCAETTEATSYICTVTVYDLPDIALTPITTKYTDEKAFVLNQGSPTGGTYYINGKAATLFNPKGNNVGSYTLRYEYTNNNGCTSTAETDFVLKEREMVTISVFSNNENLGTVSGGTTMLEGYDITVTATANANGRFIGWHNAAGDILSTDAEYTFTATQSELLYAYFVPAQTTGVQSGTNAEAYIYVEQRRIVCNTPFTVYDMLGRDVTRQNGSLHDGVYVVKAENTTQKVVLK